MSIILGIATALGAFGMIVGVPISIVLGIIALVKKDPIKRKELSRIALWFFLVPILLTIIPITLWALRIVVLSA